MWLKIPIDLETDAANVHLLRELDRWIALGLLSEGQAINLGRQLSSSLPISQRTADVVAHENLADPKPTKPREPIFAGFKSRLVQSFLEELSVLWLLFLGVFLVVVSSAVLAASRWQSFSVVGQYSILLLYTLAFGGVSYWAGTRSQLKTTAQMLKAATLLLIPLNMWMMDALGVVAASRVLAVLAGVGLSGLTLVLTAERRAGGNLVGLSWLHWGWGMAGWPLAAAYVGTVGSAVNHLLGVRANDRGGDTTADARGQLPGILIALSLAILLLRSWWIAQVPLAQLGLALGVCGWMLCRLNYPIWSRLGAGLLVLGWLGTAGEQPLQAMGVSGLAIWLLRQRLQQSMPERQQVSTLATLWLVGFQAVGWGWLVWPVVWRQGLLAFLGQFSVQPVSALNFAGLWLFGYVALMLWFSRRFRRQGQAAWSGVTDRLTVGFSLLLVLLNVTQVESFLFTFSLVGLAATLGCLARLRQPAMGLVYATHGAALATGVSGLYVVSEQLGGWAQGQWATVWVGLTLVEWAISVASHRYPGCRRAAWSVGIGLSAIGYCLFLNSWDGGWNLAWILVPSMLTVMAYRPPFERPKQATRLAVLTLVGQLILLRSWPMATVALGLGAGLLWAHSRRWPTQRALPVFSMGAAVGCIHAGAIWLWLLDAPWPYGVGHFFLVVAVVASGLTILAQLLARRSGKLFANYCLASRSWSCGLAWGLALGLTGLLTADLSIAAPRAIQPLSTDGQILVQYGLGAMALVLARLSVARLRSWWELAYGVGLVISMGIALAQGAVQPAAIAMAMVALALTTQLMGTVLVTKKQGTYPVSWHYIPLAYGALGLVLGHASFTATTGFYAAVVGIVAVAIGRRQPHLRRLGYGGLGLLSLGLYELVVYRMLQASGGAAGDGLTLLALVGAAIAVIYLLCQRWIQRFSHLPPVGIALAARLHWMLGVALATLAMVSGHSRSGVWLWLGVATVLGTHALLKGNARWFPINGLSQAQATSPLPEGQPDGQPDLQPDKAYSQWTWSGLTIATVAMPYGLEQLVANLHWIRGWGSLGLCVVSLIIYQLPWQRWGWPVRPWRRMALGWPMLGILFSLTAAKTQSLLLVGAFYAVMAQRLRAVRLSYLSLILFNASWGRYLLAQGWFTLLWLVTMVSASALYILEVDPRWQPITLRKERHYLRSAATFLIGITAIYQAEVAATPSMVLFFIGASLLISIGFVLLGLANQVRAYLYVGTLTFILQIWRTIMMFIRTDGSTLWAVGIVLGIALIWIAATFESRRTQVRDLLRQWSTMLHHWD
ncbi:hypothetical protein [Leptothoe kymatousa]|uniref:DUF2157 domain-containing protein n=1 Tax=Leptothoe kymatousa TAU-MAC 1615 TaxID=2364775 RepID=A0ABS5XZX2_9CYAN|nr:hypothetical protein [Leptothoe kymatousa]MBT9310784.1 hypothetical protein [Leptothoe kymatousa TAU-MAC 1615]